MEDRIIKSHQPTVAIVIGTYACTPYVHLGLEMIRRNCANVPVLVHDDCSGERDRLAGVASRYNADFVSTDRRYDHTCGDLMVFWNGLHWARERGVELLVKFSRRWIPTAKWLPELCALAYISQYGTYSGGCCSHAIGFRTECMALHVASYFNAGVMDLLKQKTLEGHEIAEITMHNLCRRVQTSNPCRVNQLYEIIHPRPAGGDAYAFWPLLGESKRVRRPDVLWHETNASSEYYAVASQCGITNYAERDF